MNENRKPAGAPASTGGQFAARRCATVDLDLGPRRPSPIAVRDDAVDEFVIRPIAASGLVADVRAEYDVDAIFETIAEHDDGFDASKNAYVANNQGWRMRPEFEGADGDPGAFWDVAAEHERPGIDITEIDGELEINDPDVQDGMPLHSGSPSGAVRQLIPGTYEGTWASDASLDDDEYPQSVVVKTGLDGHVTVLPKS